MLILGIETSCDETAVALYSEQGLLGETVYSQVDLHKTYGGVVPELASRDHVKKLLPLARALCQTHQIDVGSLDAIAYTKGPGLVGALLVGSAFAKGLALALGIPAIGVHHLEAHMLAVLLEPEVPKWPFLCLLVSGGHTQLFEVRDLGDYRLLGQTLDDAVGECFDKIAKLMGLPYPGGKALSELARQGTPNRYQLPRPLLHKANFDFSFSGLKTKTRLLLESLPDTRQNKADVAHAFQEAITDTLATKTMKAMAHTGIQTLVVSGGVAANSQLREVLSQKAKEQTFQLFFPSLRFCTDNAAMVALTGFHHLQRGRKDQSDDIEVLPRWPLTSL